MLEFIHKNWNGFTNKTLFLFQKQKSFFSGFKAQLSRQLQVKCKFVFIWKIPLSHRREGCEHHLPVFLKWNFQFLDSWHFHLGQLLHYLSQIAVIGPCCRDDWIVYFMIQSRMWLLRCGVYFFAKLALAEYLQSHFQNGGIILLWWLIMRPHGLACRRHPPMFCILSKTDKTN